MLDDLTTISDLFLVRGHSALREYRDRCSVFYTLEDRARAKSTANHAFLMYEGRTWTFRETYDTALKYGTWLKAKYKVAPKEIIALDFMNRPEMLFLMLGLWSVGAYPALINYNLTGAPLIHCLGTSTARLALVDEAVADKFTAEVTSTISSSTFRDGKGPMETVTFTPATASEVMSSIGVREPDSSRSGDLMHGMAALIFTSGTTGLPKAAIVSWAKIIVGGKYGYRWMGLGKKDRFYTCMPLYHSSATVLGFGTCLVGGCTFVVGHRFSNHTFWPEVRDSDATVIQYVGETLRYLLAAPPQKDPVTGEDLDRKNNVRIAFGNGLRADVWKRVQERFGIETIAEFYSATEGAGATWNLCRNDFAVGAIGRNGWLNSILVGSRSKIVQLDWETELPFRDPKNHNFCVQLPRGQPGELLFKIVDPKDIARAYQGYFNNTKATGSKIMRSVFEPDDAFFRTGDVVRWDNEGRWWFCDRIGDTFRWKSENVSTAEVSEVLGTHPAIEEANVYGVELPHHEGRAGCAMVTCNGRREVDQKDLDSVAAHVTERLPRYAVPLFLRVTKNMQATGNNKQQKHLARAQGVKPETIRSDGDQVFWLKEGTYETFDDDAWKALEARRVKL